MSPTILRPLLRTTSGAAAASTSPRIVPPSRRRRDDLKRLIAELLRARNATLVAHYYVDADVQDLALATDGCLADSLEMARFGRDHAATTLVVAGVRFMGETAKILSPGKRVLMPDLEATCSLDLGCPPDAFAAFCDEHLDRTVVVYANTSAAVKARADWMVTSACALPIVARLKEAGHKFVWGPDKHLGSYIARQTGADMLLWNGACIVHDEFKAVELALLREQHPQAQVLVHPESPEAVVALADVVGSTSRLLQAVVEGRAREYIVATDSGILHRMRQLAPDKVLIEAPTAGESATCKSCAHCPWMAMNDLEALLLCLQTGQGEIVLADAIAVAARRCIDRMLDFVTDRRCKDPLSADGGFISHIGAA